MHDFVNNWISLHHIGSSTFFRHDDNRVGFRLYYSSWFLKIVFQEFPACLALSIELIRLKSALSNLLVFLSKTLSASW